MDDGTSSVGEATRNREPAMKMMNVLLAAGVVLAGLAPAWAEDAAGKWTGMVKAPDGDIPFVLTVTRGADGKLTAVGESPSQAPGAQIPAENVTSDGAKLTFDVAAVAGGYSGVWDEAKKAWVGTWKQQGFDMALDFARAP
jgi:hypothetical protein